MKIIEIIPQLSSGGAERFVVDLCNILSKNNEVILVVLHNIDVCGFFKDELSDKVRILCMKKRMGFDIRMFGRLYRLITREKPNVVHMHLNAILYSFPAWLFIKKVVYVDTIHSDASKEGGHGIKKWLRKLAFKTGKVIPVTISEESKRSFEEFYKCPSVLILNGRPRYNMSTDISAADKELSIYRRDINTRIIINVARVTPEKNQVSLAVAIENLNKKNFSLELVILGRYEKNDEIVKQLQGYKHTHLIGQRSNPRDYMRAADAFCLSSLYEGMPITLIECFSVGAIPLCTPVGGIKNMIADGMNGILSNGSSEKDIEEMLIRFCYLSDKNKSKIKDNSLDSFAKYDMNVCANNYLNLFKQYVKTN